MLEHVDISILIKVSLNLGDLKHIEILLDVDLLHVRFRQIELVGHALQG